MKIAVCTVAYNEAEWIKACVEQFKPLISRHLVLVSAVPWFGEPLRNDGTAEIAAAAGAEVYVQHWASESEQRNWGLARLYDYDYVLIIDADEFFSRSRLQSLITQLGDARGPCYRAAEMHTYWKTTDYVCYPYEAWDAPVIAVDPKRTKFNWQRQIQPIEENRRIVAPTLPVRLYHMSWVKSDEKVLEKISTFSHATHIRPGWYENVWKKWTPEMNDIIPYGPDMMKAIYSPCPSLAE
jgi:glycosyltransferase involved in cell wall biosynthesis